MKKRGVRKRAPIQQRHRDNAQSAITYVIVAGIILLTLIPLLYFSLTSVSRLGSSQLTESVKTLQTNIDSLAQLSPGARTRVFIQIPEGVVNSDVQDYTLWFLNSRGERFSTQLLMPADGSLPLQEGSHYIDLYHNGTHIIIYQCGNGVIEASEQCEENILPYCKVIPPGIQFGCVGPSEVGACNCRCSQAEHCFTNRCVVPSGQTTGYCASCSDDSECPSNLVCVAGKCVSKTPPTTTLEFALTLLPTEVSTPRGSIATLQVKASHRGGVSEPVSFVVTGLPPSITATFLPANQCMVNPRSSCTVTLQLQTQLTTPLGKTEFIVEGIASAQTQTAKFNLTVEQLTVPFCKFPYNFQPHPQGSPVKMREGVLTPNLIGPDPFVLYDSSSAKFKMWRTSFRGNQLGIAYADSDNGYLWNDGIGLALQPIPGTWEGKLETNTVIQKPNGDLIMIYMGYPGLSQGSSQVFPGPGRRKHLGVAQSGDGIFWTRQNPGGFPILGPTELWEENWWNSNQPPSYCEGGIEEPALVLDTTVQPNIYRLWYAASGYINSRGACDPEIGGPLANGPWGHRIGAANSSDLFTWTKYTTNPVFLPQEGKWDSAIVSHTNVIPDPYYGYHLFYNGARTTSNQAIGHAWSADGVTWERNPNNPLILTRDPEGPNVQLVGGATAIWKDDNLYLWVMRSPPGTGKFEGQVTIELYTTDECLPPP